MRVSGEEFLRLSTLRESHRGADAESADFDFPFGFASGAVTGGGADVSRWEEARLLGDDVDMNVPDVREDVVASLRARIESGSYLVSGEQIAEMIIRRLLADHVR